MSSDDIGHVIAPVLAAPDAQVGETAIFDSRPPGERYYRHPGDAVRLVLWTVVTVLVAIFISVATSTSDGLTADLGRAAARLSTPVRELLLALLQIAAIALPVVAAAVLIIQQRWRRLGFIVLTALASAAVFVLLDQVLDVSGRAPDAVTSGTWVASTRFPSLLYVCAVAGATTAAKPWLSRSWRRAADVALAILVLVLAIAGTAGVPGLLLAVVVGLATGAALLVLLGAPNRRPSPAAVALALRAGGVEVRDLSLERAEGGRAQLYAAHRSDDSPLFVKVYAGDSRDADLLYRGYRRVLLRGLGDPWPAASLEQHVEHQAFVAMWAVRAGVHCPQVELVTSLPDGSMALALEYVDGRRLDALAPDEIDDAMLDAVWREVRAMHDARIAHRALRTANILIAGGRPVLIDLGFGEQSATPRMQAIDRAELMASLSKLVGAERAVAAAARVVEPGTLAASAPFLQPLALSAATRKGISKSSFAELRSNVAEVTGQEAAPLERLVRVRPRTLMTIAALVGAFYLLLPKLADVGDSFTAIRSANWGWVAAVIALSLLTYVAGAIGVAGSVRERLPFVHNLEAQFASSFVNRVTPANVGGMALNVRFLQKAGVPPSEAVTGIGLNALVGGVVHAVLLVVFFAWAKQSAAKAFKIPSSSKLLVVIAVVLALVGIALTTRKGRKLFEKHVIGFVKRSFSTIVVLSKSPAKLLALWGGSAGVTLAYIASFAAAVAAFDGPVSFAQAGAVYLGASIIAAAAPTPGGLGAMEAGLVAGLTGVGMSPGPAVAAVLTYRLATYWLPVLPGWIFFHVLEHDDVI
jgi:glycosyltransferase 2 family protein